MQIQEDKTLVCPIYHCSPSIKYSSWSLVDAHLVFTELTKHPIGTIPHAESVMSMTKCSSQEAYLSGDKKKKKKTHMILDSDNGIKSKG